MENLTPTLYIIAVISVKYDFPTDTQILGYFTTKEKAIAFCVQEFKRINPKNLSLLLPPDLESFKSYERFEYNTYYGNFASAYELRPVAVF